MRAIAAAKRQARRSAPPTPEPHRAPERQCDPIETDFQFESKNEQEEHCLFSPLRGCLETNEAPDARAAGKLEQSGEGSEGTAPDETAPDETELATQTGIRLVGLVLQEQTVSLEQEQHQLDETQRARETVLEEKVAQALKAQQVALQYTSREQQRALQIHEQAQVHVVSAPLSIEQRHQAQQLAVQREQDASTMVSQLEQQIQMERLEFEQQQTELMQLADGAFKRADDEKRALTSQVASQTVPNRKRVE